MALSVVVFVGDSYSMIDQIIAQAKKLKVDSGYLESTDVAPVCYKELKDRIIQIVNTVEKEGGKVLLDGTKFEHSTL